MLRRFVMAIFALILLLPAAPTPAAQAVREVSIVAKEFSFTPAALSLRAGQRAVLRLTNRGTMDHEFLTTLFKAARGVVVRVDGVKVEADEMEEVEFERGRSVAIELTPTRPGTYAFWCAEVTNGKIHRDLGMKGTIRVTR